MSDSVAPRKPRSVALAAEKARAVRVQRLKAMLEQRIENPIAAIDTLIAEASEGASRSELWEQLHAAAMRDGLEAEVADAYVKCANGPRMKRLSPEAQAEVLMHAADFFQGMRGDAATAETFLERVVGIVPAHVEAFGRLERRFEKLLDARRLLELYANVAAAPPRPVNVLATQAFNRVLQLTTKDGTLSDDACRKLLALVPTNPRLLDALEGHCRATKRAGLACALLEQVLADETAPEAVTVQRRQRLLELYVGEAAAPAEAIPHVEKLLERDPTDAFAIKAAEKLLSAREVASRAAAALQAARRARSG
jgi:hypothetical protein